MPKFSVIIPVYNVEDYLHQAVDSILNQSYHDFELILVDDGSKDGSPKICDSYREKDSRVVVLHKANGGAAAARNDGIRLAKGEYITFMDSDDYWDDMEILSIAAEKIDRTNADVVEGGLKVFDFETGAVEGYTAFPEELLGDISTEAALKLSISSATYKVSAGIKIICREFLLKNELFFPEGVTCEDILWGIKISAVAPKYAFLNRHYYCYRAGRPGSVTSNIREKNIQDYLFVLQRSYEAADSAPGEIPGILRSYLLYQCMISFTLVYNLDAKKQIKQKYIADFYSLCKSDMKEKPLNRTAAKAWKIYRIFGLKTMIFVLGQYLKLR